MTKVVTKRRHIGKNISQIRESREMTQEELAKLIGTSQQMVSKHEQAEELDENVLEKISKGLGVEVEYILAYNPDSHAKTVNNFTNNEIKGGGNLGNFSGSYNEFHAHALDQVVAMHHDMKAAYEQLIAEKEKLIQELLKKK